MSQALYRKWRPRLWEQVVGQDHVVQTLKNAIRAGRVGHAYLFAGPRGTGKTTSARLFAKAVNCLADETSQRPCDVCAHCLAVNEGRFLDLIEIDAASNTSVDDVRDLREKINFSPNQGRYKVYIVDEVHMLSTAAFNALLKTLEEPPGHAIFILATTEVHKIPATVLSRCQQFEFRRIPVVTILHQLKDLCVQENLPADDNALSLIARQSTGSLRDAISLLDQLASTGERISLEMAQHVLGTASSQMVVELVEAIHHQHSADGLNSIHRALDSGSDPRQFARQIVDYLRNLMLVSMGIGDQIDATPEQHQQMLRHAQAFDLPYIMEMLGQFNSAATDLRAGWQPGLLLELALAQSLEFGQRPQAGWSAARSDISRSAGTEPVVPAPPGKRETNPVGARVDPPRMPNFKQPEPVLEQKRPSKAKDEEEQTPQPGQLNHKPEVTLQSILENWNKIRAQVKLSNPSTEGLLNSCKSITMRENVLQLGFASELLRAKMEKDDNIKIAIRAIQQVLEVEVPIACIVVSPRGGAITLEGDADGMVNAALNLGGKIVHKE